VKFFLRKLSTLFYFSNHRNFSKRNVGRCSICGSSFIGFAQENEIGGGQETEIGETENVVQEQGSGESSSVRRHGRQGYSNFERAQRLVASSRSEVHHGELQRRKRLERHQQSLEDCFEARRDDRSIEAIEGHWRCRKFPFGRQETERRKDGG